MPLPELPQCCRARMMVATIACQSLGMLLAAAIALLLLKNVDSAQTGVFFFRHDPNKSMHSLGKSAARHQPVRTLVF